MYLQDGGGAATPAGPTFTGTQRLRIEPDAIPEAVAAFKEAFERVDTMVGQLEALPVRQWAADPVSGETATQFSERTCQGADSALKCLKGYRDQLAAAVDSLTGTRTMYANTEEANTTPWLKYV